MNSWLNYHHLYYFWVIVQEQTISNAAQRLRLAQPTLSAQLKQLEESLSKRLFERQGRTLQLTEDGKLVFQYADDIFSLGAELQAVLQGSYLRHELRLRVGVVDSVPKSIVHRCLFPVFKMKEKLKLQCYEGKREMLFSQLGAHQIDLVIADSPFAAEVAVKAFNHPMGSSGISLFASNKLAQQFKGRGVKRFQNAPFILPTRNTMLRRALDTWFEMNDVVPDIVAEFEDGSLIKTFGADGLGLFPVASVVEKEVQERFDIKRVAKLQGVKEDFFAISLERKVTHPAISTITDASKNYLQL